MDTISDDFLNGSLLSPNGVEEDSLTPTSGQKWWAALVLGFLFALVSNALSYSFSDKLISRLGGMPMTTGGPTLQGLLLHTFVFILLVRLILW